MNLVVDFGNSSAKVGIFDQRDLIEKYILNSSSELQTFLGKSTSENIIVSSVSQDSGQILDWAKGSINKFILTHTLALPITNQYSTPETLGVDRIAGVCGAQSLFPDTGCLVIDMGSCITYDFLDDKGVYHGGSISPGLSMRFKAVHTFTARLPLVKPLADPPLIGKTTETNIQSGVLNGLTAEIKGIISLYQHKFKNIKVILCGGDAHFFENKLKGVIFAVPELVLIGLNSILIHNVDR
jgi:type III pantothenate kinase